MNYLIIPIFIFCLFFFMYLIHEKAYKKGLEKGLQYTFADDADIIEKHGFFQRDIIWKLEDEQPQKLGSLLFYEFVSVNTKKEGSKIRIKYYFNGYKEIMNHEYLSSYSKHFKKNAFFKLKLAKNRKSKRTYLRIVPL